MPMTISHTENTITDINGTLPMTSETAANTTTVVSTIPSSINYGRAPGAPNSGIGCAL